MKLRSLWPILLFALAFVVGLVVLADALPAMSVLQAPDAAPGPAPTSLFRRMLPWMSGAQPSITHDDLLKVFPALVYHELSFILSTALGALAMGVYLRTLGLSIGACLGGGLVLAFSGYHFTLFNAGHRGYFIMMPYAIFMFALAEQALRRPRWFHFALIALCAICGISTQPDVFLLLVMLLAAYGLFRLVQIGADVGAGKYFATVGTRLLAGVVFAAIVFAAFGHGSVRQLFDVMLAGRQEQIARATGAQPGAPAEAKSPEQIQKERDDLWIFATNWSLPPEDTAEFIAPCPRGLDTGNPKGPYWGRLGQSANFAEHADRPFDWLMQRGIYPNFRQHSLYIGAIAVALAMFALFAAAFGLLKPDPDTAFEPGDVRRHSTGIAAFWGAAALIYLVIAMGRYTPVYRLIYALPVMDKIRAPVKFVHLVEVAVAVLSAFGLARLLRPVAARDDRRFRLLGRVFVVAAVAAAAACLLNAQMTGLRDLAPAMKPVLAPLIAAWKVSAEPVHRLMAELHHAAFMRAAWLLGLAGAAVAAVAFSKGAARRAVAVAFCALLVAANVLDTAEVARRFVVVNDVSGKFAGNPIATALKAKGKVDGLSASYLQLVNQPLSGETPFLDTLGMEGVAILDPVTSDTPDSMRVKTLMGFGQDLVKRWKFWGAAAVMSSPQQAREMTRQGLVKVVGLYDLDAKGRIVSARDPMKAQVAVSEPIGMIPSVAVFYGWRAAPAEDAVVRIAQPDFDMDREIVVSGEGVSDASADRRYTPAEWLVAPSETRGSRAVVMARAEKPGMLFIRENRFGGIALAATVNGRRATVHKANGSFIAVPVDAGESTVVLRPAVSAPHIAGTAAALAFAIACLVAFARDARRRTMGPGCAARGAPNLSASAGV